MVNKPKKIIILDVDGVIFKGQFLLHTARYLGKLIYVRTSLLCLLFNMGKLSIEEMLSAAYARFKDITLEQAEKIYQNIPLIHHAKQTIEILRDHGYYVVLISSGVPDLFVKDLAARLSANDGYGVQIGVHDLRLTGEVYGTLIKPQGKSRLVEEILHKNNLTWQETIVLVDDCNNLDIMQKAGIAIGVNAHYAVRRQANYLIDSGNLAEVIDILDVADADTYKALFAGMRKQMTYSWLHEIRRKVLHVLVACMPFFPTGFYPVMFTAIVLLMIAYAISECFRINGYSFPLLGGITRSSIRKAEERGFAFGPITLLLGAGLSLVFFSPVVSSTVIWIVAFADAIATIVGRSMGNHRIPYNVKKSIEGSLAAWIVAFLCGCVYLPLFPAMISGLFASLIESLQLRSLDNLFVPIGTGLLLLCLGY
ncbi:MAG: haloacid dehalogenase-like hydrolase [Planctomycetes bacterium]|nr:haloacid dehalogenase-like hydrolase [Planctomycetota bacterium]